jgi:hypothetical protein
MTCTTFKAAARSSACCAACAARCSANAPSTPTRRLNHPVRRQHARRGAFAALPLRRAAHGRGRAVWCAPRSVLRRRASDACHAQNAATRLPLATRCANTAARCAATTTAHPRRAPRATALLGGAASTAHVRCAAADACAAALRERV